MLSAIFRFSARFAIFLRYELFDSAMPPAAPPLFRRDADDFFFAAMLRCH